MIRSALRWQGYAVQFSLQSLLISVVIVWSAIAALDLWGAAVAAGLIGSCVVSRYLIFASRGPRVAFLAIAGLSLGACMIWFSTPDVYLMQQPSPIATCENRLTMLKAALDSYRSKTGSFPPEYTVGDNGEKLYSWRVVVLPFLEEFGVFSRFNLRERWNGPNNAQLSPSPCAFDCPVACGASGMTSYLAVVGEDAAWNRGTPPSLRALPDGGSHTIILVEAANSGIQWAEPRDLTVEEAIRAIQAGAHLRHSGYFYHDRPGVTNVVFGDGRVKSLPATLQRTVLESLMTIQEPSKPVDIDSIVGLARLANRPALRWDRIVSLLILAGAVGVLLFRSIRHASPIEGSGR